MAEIDDFSVLYNILSSQGTTLRDGPMQEDANSPQSMVLRHWQNLTDSKILQVQELLGSTAAYMETIRMSLSGSATALQ